MELILFDLDVDILVIVKPQIGVGRRIFSRKRGIFPASVQEAIFVGISSSFSKREREVGAPKLRERGAERSAATVSALSRFDFAVLRSRGRLYYYR